MTKFEDERRAADIRYTLAKRAAERITAEMPKAEAQALIDRGIGRRRGGAPYGPSRRNRGVEGSRRMIAALALKVGPVLEVVVPEDRRLHWRAIEDIERALERHDVGDLDGAQALLRMLEARLGVNEHHRIAASSAVRAGPFLAVGPGARISASIRGAEHTRRTQERQRARVADPARHPADDGQGPVRSGHGRAEARGGEEA